MLRYFAPILGIVVVIMIALSPSDSSANHPAPDPSYGYAWLWWDLYPSSDWPGWSTWRDHNIYYRLCEIPYWQEADAALQDWLSKFSFGSQQFWKTSASSCGIPSDLLFFGAQSQEQLVNFCGSYAPACIKPVEEATDPLTGRVEAKRADSIIEGPRFASWTPAQAKHAYAHEIGHMFGLAHHSNCTVMGPAGCTALASTADISRARCSYIYAC